MNVIVDDPVLTAAFMREMVRQLRALDRNGDSDACTAAQLLDPYVLTPERKRAIPLIGDPDEAVIDRIQAFYRAISVLIEQHSGLLAVPLVHLHYEGFGRVLITVGKLVVLDRPLRDVHRFGFRSLAALREEGERVLQAALTLIEKYPEAAAG